MISVCVLSACTRRLLENSELCISKINHAVHLHYEMKCAGGDEKAPCVMPLWLPHPRPELRLVFRIEELNIKKFKKRKESFGIRGNVIDVCLYG